MNTYSRVLLPLLVVLLVLHVDWSNAKTGDKSYLDDIKLSYENGTWQCNRIVCPPETYGCRIEQYTDPNYADRIRNLNYCYVIENGTKIITDSFRWTDILTLPITLEFFINSDVEAPTLCSYGCSLWSQNFNGTANVTEWPAIQESQRLQVQEIGEPHQEISKSINWH